MCRIVDIVCKLFLKHVKDPLVQKTLLTALEMYALSTDNELDNELVKLVALKLTILKTEVVEKKQKE